MSKEDGRERLIHATMRLLTQTKQADTITARQIAAEAGANLAMINYYFTSKDALMSAAVDRIIAERAVELEEIKAKEMPPKERLIEFLVKISDITVEYARYTRSTIPYVLLEKELEEPYHLLPMVKECCGETRTETECRMIAYQLTIFSQVAFFRSDDFRKYSGLDMRKGEDRITMFAMMVDLLT